jgi:hypothetical protein
MIVHSQKNKKISFFKKLKHKTSFFEVNWKTGISFNASYSALVFLAFNAELCA